MQSKKPESDEPVESEQRWPHWTFRFLLCPIAKFDWRRERDMRVRTSRMRYIQGHPIDDRSSIKPINEYPVTFWPDGMIRFDCPRKKQVELVITRKCSQVFEFYLPKDLPDNLKQYKTLTKIPLIRSDGRYQIFSDTQGRPFRALAYQGDRWDEYAIAEHEADTDALISAGFENYQYLAKRNRFKTLLGIAFVILLLVLGTSQVTST